jgi:hypothetical protein
MRGSVVNFGNGVCSLIGEDERLFDERGRKGVLGEEGVGVEGTVLVPFSTAGVAKEDEAEGYGEMYCAEVKCGFGTSFVTVVLPPVLPVSEDGPAPGDSSAGNAYPVAMFFNVAAKDVVRFKVFVIRPI